ncbi:MAG TPA: neuraminidase-like domain-containing protein [Solirubrobacterales bacterium]|nr:neuraminidase-like domain-containing protein [Solirubrobacterales bacterium]
MEIQPGLAMGTSGEEVEALHGALSVIGLQIEPEEREASAYGASTVAAVVKLQALAGIEQSGEVDENTTAAVELALDRLGIRPEDGGFAAAPPQYAVAGTVTDPDGAPLVGAIVVAFDCELRDRIELGREHTDEAGEYRVPYEAGDLIGERRAGDLQVEVRGRNGRVLAASPIAFSAPPAATIDLALGGPERTQQAEIVAVGAAVTPLLGGLAPVELQEDEEHRDLSFLAGESGIEKARLATWVVATRLAEKTDLPAELFYGLLRCGVPADADVQVLASTSAGVDFEANGANVLDAILQTAPETLAAAVDHAIAANLLPASYAGSAAADVARLAALRSAAALQSPRGFGKTSFGAVLGAVGLGDKVQRRFIERYLASAGGAPRGFWRGLEKDSGFSAKTIEDLRFAMTVGRLTRGHMPLIERLAAQRKAGKISHAADLARLTAADWKQLLKSKGSGRKAIGAPPLVDAPSAAQAIDTYAAMLERFFTRSYPTAAFSARVAADRKGPFKQGRAVAAVLDANPKVDLRFASVDHLGQATELAPEVREDLLAAQRLVKVNPDYTVMSTLLADGISSAQQIYAMGRDSFVAAYGGLPGQGTTEAARTWARAEQTFGVALATALKFNISLDRNSPAAIGAGLSEKAPEKLVAFPNLQTLFGSESFCACEDCESVLGAAAYLVDCLEFLKQRAAVTGNVRDALLARRPDIAQIELTCENTNTELPYIDLVNELLEDAVAPGPTPAAQRQTTLTTPELNANPEYPNDPAYEALAEAVYPWTLPFDLPLTEARTYLKQIGLSRVGLTETFRPPPEPSSPELDALAVERLGLTALEADIVTGGPLAAGHKPWDFWGLAQNGNSIVDPDDPTKTVTGTWISVLSQVRVLLNRAGLSFEELRQLLNTIFVNGEETLAIVADPPDSCDVAKMTLGGLDKGALERLHRFVRLMRRLGWDPYELDDALAVLQSASAPGLGRLDAPLLRRLAAVRDAAERFSLPVPRAVAFFAPTANAVTIETREVPTLPGEEVRHSLYHELFENLTVLNPPDPAFTLDAARDEIATAATLAEHTAGLVAGLQVSETDLLRAIEAFTDGQLTLANLSTLLRVTQLAAGLELTIDELLTLLAIAERPLEAAPHHAPIDPFDGTEPESLRAFAEAAARLAAAGLGIEQVDYVLRGVERPGVAPDPVLVGTLLLTLRKGLDKIAGEYAFAPDPRGLATRKALGRLLGGDQVAAVMAVLDGSSAESEAAQGALLTSALEPYIDVAAALPNLVGGAARPAGEARFEYVLAAVLAYQRRNLGTGLIVQSLAQSLGLSSATAALLLTAWFPSTGSPGAFLIDDLLALPAPADPNVPVPPDEPGFAPYFAAYAALAKVATLVSALQLGDDDVRWWRERGVGQGWLDPTALPATPAAGAEGRFQQLARLLSAGAVRDRVPIPHATFASLFELPDGASKSEYMTALAELANWPAETLAGLCGDPGSTADQGALRLAYPDDYLSETALARILPCERTIARTGIPADVGAWIASPLTVEAAKAIKRSVKSNYSDLQWPQIAKDLCDGVRMERRDALVSYLLANPPAGVGQWRDSDDVFAHFLIDVEMCSCMSTSRIVQATAAVQLFVQRCFLSLEPEVAIDIGADGKWLQWQWMGQFRLSQANREVLLFPEDWVDPTLRKSKTPFFAELEQDLKQGDLTDEAAEAALASYLEKLEAVARLDVVGTFHDIEEGRDTLHVLARSQGSPPQYYHRRRLDAATWDAWEEVKLDIASDHAIPVTWNGRHYVFWAIVTHKPNRNNQPEPPAKTSNDPQPRPQTHLEIQLAWSQYKQGKWQGKQTAPQTLVYAAPDFPPEWDAGYVTLKSAANGRQLEVDVFAEKVAQASQRSSKFRAKIETPLHKGAFDVDNERLHIGSYVLGGAGTGIEALVRFPEQLADAGGPSVADVGTLAHPKPDLVLPTATRFDGNWAAPAKTHYDSAQRTRTAGVYAGYDLYGALPSELLLEKGDNFRLVTPHQTPAFDSSLPFFYRDQAREYFVVPTLYYQNGNYFTITAPPYVYHPFYKAQYGFWPFYHPFVGLLVAQLNMNGIDSLYERQLQLDPAAVQGTPKFSFGQYYKPTGFVQGPYPGEGIDFEPNAGYALYNWELFFHVPFLIANQLSTNLQFEHAKKYYEYVLSPAAATKDPVPQRYWITKPFYETTSAQYAEEQIDALMQAVNHHDPTLEHQVAAWRADPFDPDMIAQLRPVAYQRAIVMKYIDNLIAWGDQLFRQDTRESINLATQMYVLADELLGPRPEKVEPGFEPTAKTYDDLKANLDTFSNEMVAAENAIPPVKVNVPTPPGAPPLPSVNTLYFRIPPNKRLLRYWDTVADRLFKIRHCMNIEGVEQHLSLFAPPIDPGALVAASAAGLDLASALSDSEAALPPYRFRTMIRHAIELCGQVQQLGTMLLGALEKSDAEALARIRSGGEKQLQAAITGIREQQIDEAGKAIEVLAKTKKAAEDRQGWYSSRDLMNTWEGIALALQGGALVSQAIAVWLDGTAAVAHVIPTFEFGAAGFGGSPSVNAKLGGKEVGHAAHSGAWVARMIAGALQTGAEMSATVGRYQQRKDEWDLQATLAADDIAKVEAESAVAEVKHEIAEAEKSAQDVSAKEATDVDEFLHSKFTDQELYDWMVSQTSTTYFQAYQLAYSIAKQAERCYRRELAVEKSDFIQFGYWDSLRKGLTAGEKLQYDLRRLESAYLAGNDRELEIVKHVSALQIDPMALVTLRETGSCVLSVPEILFDLDNPGHYLRRLKSVAVSVPCVVGPYTGVSMTVELLRNQVRTAPETAASALLTDEGGTSEIVTSSAQHDDGLFELRFEDERYLPFEGAGAISTWRLTLNNVRPQFDYRTIGDVILHLRYTARHGGGAYADTVRGEVASHLNSIALENSRQGLYRLFSARHDFAAEWTRFLNPAPGTDQILSLETPPERFPFFTTGLDLKAKAVDVIVRTADGEAYDLVLTPPGGSAITATVNPDPTLDGANHYEAGLSPASHIGRAPSAEGAEPPTWTVKLKRDGAADFRSLTAADLEDVLLVVSYQAK